MPQVIRSEGTLFVPKDELMNWLISMLKVPAGTFVALSEPRMNGNQLEVLFAEATDYQPAPPVWPPA